MKKIIRNIMMNKAAGAKFVAASLGLDGFGINSNMFIAFRAQNNLSSYGKCQYHVRTIATMILERYGEVRCSLIARFRTFALWKCFSTCEEPKG